MPIHMFQEVNGSLVILIEFIIAHNHAMIDISPFIHLFTLCKNLKRSMNGETSNMALLWAIMNLISTQL